MIASNVLFRTSSDFWPRFQSQALFPCMRALAPACNRFLRFPSGATPADLLVSSMVAELFQSTYFRTSKLWGSSQGSSGINERMFMRLISDEVTELQCQYGSAKYYCQKWSNIQYLKTWHYKLFSYINEINENVWISHLWTMGFFIWAYQSDLFTSIARRSDELIRCLDVVNWLARNDMAYLFR